MLLTVLRDGELIDICPAGQARCVIEVPPAPPTPTPLPTSTLDPSVPTETPIPTWTPTVPAPTALPVTAEYPCNATITTARGTVLNVVTEFASGGNTRSVRAGQEVIILGKTPPSAAIPKYQIRDVATGRDLGWIATEYVVLSPSCPKGQ